MDEISKEWTEADATRARKTEIIRRRAIVDVDVVWPNLINGVATQRPQVFLVSFDVTKRALLPRKRKVAAVILVAQDEWNCSAGTEVET